MAMQERARRTRERLLETALELLAEKGSADTTFEAISEASGISRGSIRFHFGSKSGLLFAVVDRAFEVWENEVLAPLLDDEGPTTFADAIDANRDFVLENPVGGRLYFVLMSEALGPNPELLPRFQELQERFRRFIRTWVEAAQRNGSVASEVDADAAAAIILGSLQGLRLQWQLDPERIDPDRVYAELTAVLDRGFAKRG